MQIALLCVFHQDVKAVVLDEGVVVLYDVRVVDCFENLNFFKSSHLMLGFHMPEADLLENIDKIISL